MPLKSPLPAAHPPSESWIGTWLTCTAFQRRLLCAGTSTGTRAIESAVSREPIRAVEAWC
ncbi:hypothetical protein BKA66DRAFT_13023 [Pyrenochaeta sp. MPI-SDFR-AT-0127]|nr:hypothetical protein BKA66DRAFT_13023 [Pyrenochaeta sp. MPI-SDFR-AT-0127]